MEKPESILDTVWKEIGFNGWLSSYEQLRSQLRSFFPLFPPVWLRQINALEFQHQIEISVNFHFTEIPYTS